MSALARSLDGQQHVIGEMLVDFRLQPSANGPRDADDLAWQIRQEM